MDTPTQVITKIIVEQQAIIGPLASGLAHQVTGIQFDDQDHVVGVQSDPKSVLHELVLRYADLFGQASIEVCRDAVRSISPGVSPELLPDELK